MESAIASSPRTQESTLLVEGMNCASCVAHVQNAVKKSTGVESCEVNLARGRAVVRFDPARTSPDQIAAAVTASGYSAAPEPTDASAENIEEERMTRQAAEARAWFRRAMVGLALWFPVEATHWVTTFTNDGHVHGIGWMTWTALVTSTIALIFVGAGFYRSAFKALKHFTSNMDTLIAMGASVAWGYSAVALLGYLVSWWQTLPNLYFMESTGLLALISLGHWLEARARQSAGSAIRELLELAPSTAQRLDGEQTIEVPVSKLSIGDRILIRPGDRVPIDGQVIQGPSSVNESMITGEPLPVTRDAGDTVIGGTQNIDGRLIVRVTKVGAETALAQIVKLVEHAQASKPAIQRLADQVAAIFVPTVLGIALVTGIGWYIWGWSHNWDSPTTWARIALAVCSVLIIACPCALGLAVPASLMVGTGLGAKKGILIRDIDALQQAENIKTVVLDKTGTITRGKPVVTEIIPQNGQLPKEILRVAAAAEQFSEHPLARAIVAHAKTEGLQIPDADSFTNEPGLGVIAVIEGRKIMVGSSALLEKHQGANGDAKSHSPGVARTLVQVVQSDGGTVSVLGTIAISDELKTDSVAAVRELHELGLRTVLLTGDNHATAEAIAEQVGIDDVRAQIKPDGKVLAIEDLQRLNPGTVAMVGDGINDAPALARADLGIAIGSGSDIAKQTSDIVLLGGSLQGIAVALRLSRATMRTIRQNLFFAFIYNVLAIPLAALGLLNPYIAAAAMALSDVTVLGNALLLRRAKLDPKQT